MSTPSTQMMTLQFVYAYQHFRSGGAYDQDHDRLAELCSKHLQLSNAIEDDSHYPWNCFPHAVNVDHDLIEISVRFVHKRYEDRSALSAPDTNLLWQALEDLFDEESSHNLFGGHGCSIYIRPLNVQEALAQQLTFGKMFPSKTNDMSTLKEALDVSESSNIVLAADEFLRIVQQSALLLAEYGPGMLSWNTEVVQKYWQSQYPSTESLSDDQLVVAGTAAPMTLDQYLNTPAATLASSVLSSLSWGTISMILANKERLRLVALKAAEARTWLKPQADVIITKEALYQIAEVTKAVLSEYQVVHLAALASVRHCLETHSSSLKAHVVALQGVRELETLWNSLEAGSKSLVTLLQNQRKTSNAKLLVRSATTMAVSAAAIVAGPPAWIATGAAYLGTMVAAASTPYMIIKGIENSTQIEGLRQNRGDVERVHRKLVFFAVVALATDIWKLDLECMLPATRVIFLRQMGVHDDFLNHSDYRRAQLKAALEEFEKIHHDLVYGIEGVLLDLGIASESVGQPVQKPLCLSNS